MIDDGNSGGALVNSKKELIGIITFVLVTPIASYNNYPALTKRFDENGYCWDEFEKNVRTRK